MFCISSNFHVSNELVEPARVNHLQSSMATSGESKRALVGSFVPFSTSLSPCTRLRDRVRCLRLGFGLFFSSRCPVLWLRLRLWLLLLFSSLLRLKYFFAYFFPGDFRPSELERCRSSAVSEDWTLVERERRRPRPRRVVLPTEVVWAPDERRRLRPLWTSSSGTSRYDG